MAQHHPATSSAGKGLADDVAPIMWRRSGVEVRDDGYHDGRGDAVWVITLLTGVASALVLALGLSVIAGTPSAGRGGRRAMAGAALLGLAVMLALGAVLPVGMGWGGGHFTRYSTAQRTLGCPTDSLDSPSSVDR